MSVSLDPEEESPIDLIGVYEDMGDIHHKMEAITEEFEVHTYIDESVIDYKSYRTAVKNWMYLK